MKSDPFPIVAPHDVDYWADNKKVLTRLIQAESDALLFPSSRIHVLFGPLGGGKSFAISYLAHPKTRSVLMKYLPSPKSKDFLAIRITASYPHKAGQLTASVYSGIFKKLFAKIVDDKGLVVDLRKSGNKIAGLVGQALRSIGHDAVQGLDGHISLQRLEVTEGYKCLTLEKSKIGSLKSQEDYVAAIGTLTDTLLRKYQRIIIAIDELENLRNVSGSERLFFNDFVRHLHQEIEVGVTLILAFTFNTFEDVAAVLQPAVISRISERVNFDYVRKKSDIVEYITECLEKRGGIDPYSVIEPSAITAIAADVTRENQPITFRDVNKELHRVFAFVFARKKNKPLKVTKAAFEDMKKAVPIQEIIKDLGDTI
ncbi:MAG: hypothetical protein ABSE39_10210 [Candidatus Bathyarchaeia archaeon]|jgi:hypothetical protein